MTGAALPRAQGLVTGGANNFFDVEDSEGASFRCSIKGKILRNSQGFYNPLAPGDRVEFQPDEKTGGGVVFSLVSRKNKFSRWNVKGGSPQILAANIDTVVVVATPREPPFRPRFVDRVLIQSAVERVAPLIVINKSDLDIDGDAHERISDWKRIGYRVLFVSALKGDGLDELKTSLDGKTSAFIGQSGVGKSSLLNALCGDDTGRRTAALSVKYGRGVHTTTRGALFHMKGRGFSADLIDTPGVRRFVLNGVSADELMLYFPEMEPLVGRCLFGLSCSHTEEPGCKILEAVYAGAVAEDRFESWLRIREEMRSGRFAD